MTDLENDGKLEVVLGFNADSGLHLIDGSGGVIWKRPDIVNVRNVAAMDTDGDGVKELLATTYRGPVLLLSAQGKNLKYLDPASLTSKILPLEQFGRHKNVILCGGSATFGEQVCLMSLDNKALWRKTLTTQSRDEISGLAVGRYADRDVVAVTTRFGKLALLDAAGEFVYRASTIASTDQPTILRGCLFYTPRPGDPQLLVIWGNRGITCLEPPAATGEGLGP